PECADHCRADSESQCRQHQARRPAGSFVVPRDWDWHQPVQHQSDGEPNAKDQRRWRDDTGAVVNLETSFWRATVSHTYITKPRFGSRYSADSTRTVIIANTRARPFARLQLSSFT